MESDHKIYVVSEDICVLLGNWASARGFQPPRPEFIAGLRDELKDRLESYFGRGWVALHTVAMIREGFKKLVRPDDPPAVSLETVYCLPRGHRLDIARAVDGELMPARDRIVARPGTPSIEDQIKRLSAADLKEITLVEDVLFTGGIIKDLIPYLEARNIRLRLMLAGIAKVEGIKLLKTLGVETRAVVVYPDEYIIDEVCERDFYAGVPYSGKVIVNGYSGNLGACYFEPLGKPAEWASIPDHDCREWSKFCFEQSIKLWTEIEERSGRIVRCNDLDRVHCGMPDDSTRFIDWLHSAKEKLST